MGDTWILLDPNTGLHVGWYFWLRVLDEVNRSARYGVPFGLLLLDPVADTGAAPRLLMDAASQVPAAVRATDLAGLIGASRVGVVLPHQNVEDAELACQRILARLEKRRTKGVRWEPRLLCYPQDGAEISNLLTTGGQHRLANAPEAEQLA